ncbi:hypothetical protein FB451DRAFT_1366141 [Mycena latifolia]|nr:hypothetical protein FB451DRAFT_1366141 [Mycena latifolia]
MCQHLQASMVFGSSRYQIIVLPSGPQLSNPCCQISKSSPILPDFKHSNFPQVCASHTKSPTATFKSLLAPGTALKMYFFSKRQVGLTFLHFLTMISCSQSQSIFSAHHPLVYNAISDFPDASPSLTAITGPSNLLLQHFQGKAPTNLAITGGVARGSALVRFGAPALLKLAPKRGGTWTSDGCFLPRGIKLIGGNASEHREIEENRAVRIGACNESSECCAISASVQRGNDHIRWPQAGISAWAVKKEGSCSCSLPSASSRGISCDIEASEHSVSAVQCSGGASKVGVMKSDGGIETDMPDGIRVRKGKTRRLRGSTLEWVTYWGVGG